MRFGDRTCIWVLTENRLKGRREMRKPGYKHIDKRIGEKQIKQKCQI